MRYEIKYKTKYLAGLDTFPTIIIKYRRCGKILWDRIEQVLDEFAHSSNLGNYISEFDLLFIDRSTRAEMFKQALDESYCNGSLDVYVRSIVLDKVKTEMDNENRLLEAEELISKFVTKGWKSIELDTNDQDEIKQHSNE